MEQKKLLRLINKGLRDDRWYIRKKCVLALRECDPPVDQVVVQAVCQTVVRDPDAEVRWTAARVLGDMQSEAAIPSLLIASQEKNRRVREEAQESIDFIRFGTHHYQPPPED